ncbi:unnamed protein product [Pedinophyceae sp. YPF-701]|nr:unnamed protein product [Pedinophyceae sp. YPF-701]
MRGLHLQEGATMSRKADIYSALAQLGLVTFDLNEQADFSDPDIRAATEALTRLYQDPAEGYLAPEDADVFERALELGVLRVDPEQPRYFSAEEMMQRARRLGVAPPPVAGERDSHRTGGHDSAAPQALPRFRTTEEVIRRAHQLGLRTPPVVSDDDDDDDGAERTPERAGTEHSGQQH